MKAIAFNGSPRRNGNTSILLKTVLDELKKEDIDVELVHLGGKPARGCMACRKCFELKNNRCAIDDEINEHIQKMLEADAIILGSPVYFSMMTPELKAFIDRTGMVSRANGDIFKRKIGACVVAVRRAGSVSTFNSINDYFLIQQMIVPGSSYWNIGLGRNEGDVSGDAEGIETMKNLGKNIAWLMKKIND